MLNDADNIIELKRAVDSLPKGLERVYDRILARIKERLSATTYDKAVRILSCVAFAKRPLKYFELLDAIALYPGNVTINHETKLLKTALDVCKPFIEEGLNQTVVFIHSSVKEYALANEGLVDQTC
jgi:hypothetical protein